jgi:hypothetical protein
MMALSSSLPSSTDFDGFTQSYPRCSRLNMGLDPLLIVATFSQKHQKQPGLFTAGSLEHHDGLNVKSRALGVDDEGIAPYSFVLVYLAGDKVSV